MLRLAWPKVSWTILGLTFFLASSVAQVCLRSWKRTSGRPARLKRGLKWRFTTFWASSGSFDSRIAISPRRSCVSGSAAVYKLRSLPQRAVSGEHALVLPHDGHPTQTVLVLGSILEPPLLGSR